MSFIFYYYLQTATAFSFIFRSISFKLNQPSTTSKLQIIFQINTETNFQSNILYLIVTEQTNHEKSTLTTMKKKLQLAFSIIECALRFSNNK